jgi:transposase-like protein
LVKALGVASGISKSEVSRICAELDRDLKTFRDRPLDHASFVYVFLDATYVKGRVGGRVVSRAVVIATGVTSLGDREVLGIDVGDSEDGAFWTAFLKGLRARGLTGVQLVTSDHHLGLKQAIGAVFEPPRVPRRLQPLREGWSDASTWEVPRGDAGACGADGPGPWARVRVAVGGDLLGR